MALNALAAAQAENGAFAAALETLERARLASDDPEVLTRLAQRARLYARERPLRIRR